MRRSARVAALAAAGAILAGVTCSFPTDQSNQVFVTVTLSQPIVVQGGQITAHAHAFRTTPSGPIELQNVDFEWSVSNATIAGVTPTTRGAAQVTGLNAGLVTLSARAAQFDKATPKDSVIRVSRSLEIDSIRPDTILYGGRLRVYGVGVKNIFLAELGPGVLVADTFSFVGDANGLGYMDFWVPPPSGTGQFFGFAPGVFTAAPDTIVVGDHDIYEPNDTSPTMIDLVTPGPTPQLPNRMFFNPALDFEALDRNSFFGVDWYRFAQTDTTQAVSFIFTATGSGRDTTIFNLITDSIYYSGGDYYFGDSSWGVGPSSGLFACRGYAYYLPQAPSDSITVEFGDLTSPKFELFAEYTQEGRYGLRVVHGLVHVDPTVLPDKFSPNEVCNQADDNFAKNPLSIEHGVDFFLDTALTIDVPHAVDWYRFHLTPTGAGDIEDTVTISTVSRTPGAQDTSDLDITVISATTFDYWAQGADSGSTETVQPVLPTGDDYYVVVSDFAGATVRYGLCIRVAASCPALPAPIPAPPGQVGSIPRRALLERMRHPAAAASARLKARGWRIPRRHP